MEMLSLAKKSVEGNAGQVEPWDVPFYTGLLKARDGFDINSVSQYLTLNNCLESMKLLVHVRLVSPADFFSVAFVFPSFECIPTRSPTLRPSLRTTSFAEPFRY